MLPVYHVLEACVQCHTECAVCSVHAPSALGQAALPACCDRCCTNLCRGLCDPLPLSGQLIACSRMAMIYSSAHPETSPT